MFETICFVIGAILFFLLLISFIFGIPALLYLWVIGLPIRFCIWVYNWIMRRVSHLGQTDKEIEIDEILSEEMWQNAMRNKKYDYSKNDIRKIVHILPKEMKHEMILSINAYRQEY